MAKLRLQITKGPEIRFISHLDYFQAIERAVRRAGLPAAYSEGFNPHMKLALGSALALGVASLTEYLDLELTAEPPIDETLDKLNRQLPPAIRALAGAYMPQDSAAIMAAVNLAAYEILLPGIGEDHVRSAFDQLESALEAVHIRQSPKGKRVIDVKDFLVEPVIVATAASGAKVALEIRSTPTGSMKPVEVLEVLNAQFGLGADLCRADIRRTGLFITDGSGRRTPLEV